MKKFILAAVAILGLAGVASAQTLSHGAPQQNGPQYNWLAGGGG